MKSKIYWERKAAETDPFVLARRVAKGMERAGQEPSPGPLKYLWLFVTDRGVHHNLDTFRERPRLGREDWLNVIDEAAAYGAEWLIIYAGSSLSTVPEIWELCSWAQETHGLKVGINLDDDTLSREDRRALLKLEFDKTFIIAPHGVLERFRDLETGGIRLCEANISREERTPCTKPEAMACVGPDGQLFSCGLVLGEREYGLGHAYDRSIDSVLRDESLPHAVPEEHAYPQGGCDGCPPLMAERISRQLES
jgi:hypothetical protein